jgi:integrase
VRDLLFVGTVGGAPAIGAPKTAAGRRAVSLLPTVIVALREHRVRQNAQRLKLGPIWQDHDLIFPTGIGTPINPNNLPRDILRLIRQAGVPRICIHDIRHTYATLALEGGANLIGVSRQLGHAKPSITSDLYGHVTAHMQQQVTDTIGAVLFGEQLPAAIHSR